LFAWEDIEATAEARALPPGELSPDLLTPFDARGSSDYERVARHTLIDLYLMPFENSLLVRAMLAPLPLLPGAVMIGAIFAPDIADDWAFRVGFPVAGLLLFSTGAIGFGKVIQRGWRRTMQWRRLRADVVAWWDEKADRS
jgi:hypothetical protein